MKTHIKKPTVLMGTAVLIGLVADYLFFGTSVGVSFPLFTCTVLIISTLVLIVEGVEVVLGNAWLIIPMLFFAIMASVRAAPLLTFLNVSGALLLLFLLAHTISHHTFSHLTLGDYMIGALQSVLVMVMPLSLVKLGATNAAHVDAEKRTVIKRVGVGVLLAAPFLCLFLLLFLSADLVFNSLFQHMMETINMTLIVNHLTLIIFFTWVGAGLMMYMLHSEKFTRKFPTWGKSEGDQRDFPIHIGLIETGIVLFSIDVLFALFVAVQFATLFGGEVFLQQQGLTYSEYARRGFFEVVTVASIVFTLLIVLDTIAKRTNKKQQLVFVTGACLMLGMTVIMLVSAVQRMTLYEEIFGFTRLRLHTHVFMGWMAVLLAAFALMLIMQKVRYFPALVLMFCIGFTATLNIINPDRFIAEHNIRRWEAGEELDMYHLASLSEDAIPVIVPFYLEHVAGTEEDRGDYMTASLSRMATRLENRQENYRWPAYHVARHQAHELLEPLDLQQETRTGR